VYIITTFDLLNSTPHCFAWHFVRSFPSNRKFDQSLKSRNPEWGVRDLETVVQAALEQDLVLVQKVEMPANNLSLIFQKKTA
jgi:Protein of unknown function (DUF938)